MLSKTKLSKIEYKYRVKIIQEFHMDKYSQKHVDIAAWVWDLRGRHRYRNLYSFLIANQKKGYELWLPDLQGGLTTGYIKTNPPLRDCGGFYGPCPGFCL